MRLPGGFQTERLVEMLEEGYGGEQMLEIERDIMQHGVRFQAYLDIGNQPASCWPGRPYRIIISGDVRTREKEPVSPHKCQGRAAWIGGGARMFL